MKNINHEKLKYIVFLSSIISCLVAFINKYPLIYPDTGSYIYSGFNGLVFDDRSIFYGLFLRHVSLASSLWYVVFAQGVLICYLIYITMGMLFSGIKRDYIFIFTITFLTLCTAFSYTVSVLIPDIFSALAILCLINLLLNKQLKKINIAIISILFILSICTQFSSIVIMLLLFFILGFYLIYQKIRSKPIVLNLRRFFFSLGLLLSCLIIIPIIHFSYGKEFKISGSTHVFVMNHLLETGVLEDYLNEKCDNKNYKICEYKDKLGWNFIWSPESPLQKTGGWKVNKEEYKEIIFDIITTPKYFVLLIQKTVEYSVKQFFTFNIEVSPPQLQGSPPYGQINWRFKDSVREYISSLQSASKWNTGYINFIQNFVIILSMVFLLLLILTPVLISKLNVEIKWIILLVFLHNMVSSVICSNLSTIDSRFQSRIVWLMPMCALIIGFKYLEKTSFWKKVFTNLNE